MMSYKSTNLIYLGIAVALGILIGSLLNYPKTPRFKGFTSNSNEAKIKRLIDYIQYDYVDAVNTDSLLDKTIAQLLTNLDPHSVYIPEDHVERVHQTMNGKFIGIGIQFRMIRDTITVINVIKNGPSDKAGLQAGDRILFADNDTLFGKKYSSDEVMDFLKSQKPEPIDLKVYRKKSDSIIDFNFKRGKVDLKSVPVYYMIDNSMGYIKVELFSRTTYDEFHQALIELKKQGMQTMILDLRNNTGGFLDVANDMIDEFLPDDMLMVFTKSKSGQIKESRATSTGDFEQGKVYVLINEESASASEIVAGAIQDNDRGVIVGRRSFGKGLVQQEMNLGDGSFVRLTTARYYTPTGRSIQKPYDHNGNETYFHDTENRSFNGELFYKDSMPIVDSLKYTTSKGKIVYGGGGIIPDVFVPLDTTLYDNSFHVIRVNDFIFNYVDNRRQDFDSLAYNDYLEHYDIQDIYQSYLKQFPTDNTKTSNLKWLLKALLAREVYGETGFYKIYQKKDNMIQKVLDLEQN